MRHFSLVVVADGRLSVARLDLGNTVRSVTSRCTGVDEVWYCVRTKAWLPSGTWPSIRTCLIEGNSGERGACTSLDQCRFSTTIDCTVTSFASTQLPRVSPRSCSCYFARDVAFLGQLHHLIGPGFCSSGVLAASSIVQVAIDRNTPPQTKELHSGYYLSATFSSIPGHPDANRTIRPYQTPICQRPASARSKRNGILQSAYFALPSSPALKTLPSPSSPNLLSSTMPTAAALRLGGFHPSWSCDLRWRQQLPWIRSRSKCLPHPHP